MHIILLNLYSFAVYLQVEKTGRGSVKIRFVYFVFILANNLRNEACQQCYLAIQY